MAAFVLDNAKLYVGGYDLSGDSHSINLVTSVEEKDSTTFGSAGYRSRLGGLRTFTLQGQGFVEYGVGENDAVLFANLGSTSSLLTVAADGGAAGEIGYFGQALHGRYESFDAVGEIMPFTTDFAGSGSLIRGTILEDAGTARTSTGNGTARAIGAASASQKLYAGLHVLSVSGTTPVLTVKVQSDDASGFASPTDRVTFSAASAVGSQWATPVAGAIADTFYRVSWTISGTNPSFLFAVTVGIA